MSTSSASTYCNIITKNKIEINQIEEITADILPLFIAPIGDQLRYKKAVETYKGKVSVESSEQTTPKGDCIIEVISKADWKNVYALKEEDENLVNDEVLAIKNTSEESA
ncbi:uncharacterized protein LOC105181107 [Harpegnathos saltator]|uniref:uncharacterized protein LOC105181107 n=1 Tax=Harpegnathos saltator TaxID=610380 RepID=UPI00058F1B70|nr:uncharacterized protein LOC105181107 [Harpegnathos saltator]